MAVLEIKGAKNIKHGGMFNRYAQMEFAPYKYEPYPRYIGDAKNGVIVNNKTEEEQARAKMRMGNK